MTTLIILTAKYSYLLSLLIGSLVWLASKHKKSLALLSLLTFPISFAVSRLASAVISDPRPFVVENVQPLIPHAPDNGFPSDHTLLAATIAAVIWTQNKKWGTVLFALAAIDGLSRVAAKVHHLQDILGSFVIAFIATYIAKLILLKLADVKPPQKASE